MGEKIMAEDSKFDNNGFTHAMTWAYGPGDSNGQGLPKVSSSGYSNYNMTFAAYGKQFTSTNTAVNWNVGLRNGSNTTKDVTFSNYGSGTDTYDAPWNAFMYNYPANQGDAPGAYGRGGIVGVNAAPVCGKSTGINAGFLISSYLATFRPTFGPTGGGGGAGAFNRYRTRVGFKLQTIKDNSSYANGTWFPYYFSAFGPMTHLYEYDGWEAAAGQYEEADT
jgi:hypothetical protein